MIAIALGDPAGIGPEIALKAIALELAQGPEKFLIIGDVTLARRVNEELPGFA
jgi:4-hydroxy-L-threonine phosphate dehydrogenase PdxA